MARGFESRGLKNLAAAAGLAAELACAPVTKEIREPEDQVTKIEHRPKKLRNLEGRELPKGAAGFDLDGAPFGWNFNNYEYFKSEPVFNDLVPMMGMSSGDVLDVVKLRESAFYAFKALEEETEHSGKAIPGLKNRNITVSSGFRTFKQQAEFRKRFEEGKGAPFAELPGRSEHHLGTAIDIKGAKLSSVYHWLMGTEKDWKNENYVPPIIRKGFVPTVSSEPWHYRYVGEEAARHFWETQKEAILRGHLASLSPDPQPAPRHRKNK